ncbi:MAG: hypothetical protein ACRC9L_02990 [Brevinema sp.]
MIITSSYVRGFFNLNVSKHELAGLTQKNKSHSLSLKNISRLEKTLISTSNNEKLEIVRTLLNSARASSCYTPFPGHCQLSDTNLTREMIDHLVSHPSVQSTLNGMSNLEKYKSGSLPSIDSTLKTEPLPKVADELSVKHRLIDHLVSHPSVQSTLNGMSNLEKYKSGSLPSIDSTGAKSHEQPKKYF